MDSGDDALFDIQVVIDLQAALGGAVSSVDFDETGQPVRICQEDPSSAYFGCEVVSVAFDPVLGRRRILVHLTRDGCCAVATFDADYFLPLLKESDRSNLWPNRSVEESMVRVMSVYLLETIGVIPVNEPLPRTIQVT
jgi:hypothetical protein